MVYTHVLDKGSKGVLITIGEVPMVHYSDQSTLIASKMLPER